MILYFSGTGNSRYIARLLAQKTGEEIRFIPECNPADIDFTGQSLGFVFPVYAWGVPPIVMDFISKLNAHFIDQVSDLPIWTAMSCGDETGNAPDMLRRALEERGVKLTGGWSVIMPNVYVLLPGFNTDDKTLEIEKLDAATPRICEIAGKLKNREWDFDFQIGSMPTLKTSVIYPLFKKWGINTRRFHWDKECMRCGKCAEVCPVGNITIQNEHPVWGRNCTSCLACYHNCPVHAVEYGRITRYKGQYVCHLK